MGEGDHDFDFRYPAPCASTAERSQQQPLCRIEAVEPIDDHRPDLSRQRLRLIGGDPRGKSQTVLLIAQMAALEQRFIRPEKSCHFRRFASECRVVEQFHSSRRGTLEGVGRNARQLPFANTLGQRRNETRRSQHPPEEVVAAQVRTADFRQREPLKSARHGTSVVLICSVQQRSRKRVKRRNRGAIFTGRDALHTVYCCARLSDRHAHRSCLPDSRQCLLRGGGDQTDVSGSCGETRERPRRTLRSGDSQHDRQRR